MMTVRFPSGLAVQYNDANFLNRTSGFWDLYTDSTKTKWIACVQESAGVLIEVVRPCSVTMTGPTVRNELEPLCKELRTIQRKLRKSPGK